MSWTKIRAFIGAVFALGLIFIMFCALSAKMGWQIPGVAQVAQKLGFM
jgi:hypothetical protein